MRKLVKQLRHGQITIPKEFREALGLDKDDLLSIALSEGKLEIEPVKVTPKEKGSPWARELYQMFAPVRAGRLDAVVNNAGFGFGGAVEDTSIDEAREMFETNFFGMLRVCRAVLPHLRERRAGTIVNVSSLAGLIAQPFVGLYCATKFAMEGATEALRMEVRPFGIHVVMIEPGDTRTGFTANRRPTQASQGSSPYADNMRRALAVIEHDEQTGTSPDAVARLLERILRSRSPRLRYPVASTFQRFAAVARKVMPGGLFERALTHYYRVR